MAATGAGRVAPGAALPGRRSGTPSSREQPEGLRTGEWVTEPVRQGRSQRQAPPDSRG
jgi:hypothetical protein